MSLAPAAGQDDDINVASPQFQSQGDSGSSGPYNADVGRELSEILDILRVSITLEGPPA